MPSLVDNLNTVDALLLATLGLSILIGAMRGLLFELMSLAGWVVAYAVAYLFSPRLLPLLPQDPMAGTAFAGSAMGPGMMPLLAFVLCFVGVLIAWGLLAQLLRLLIRATPLSGFDRLLGSVFGLLRGGLILTGLGHAGGADTLVQGERLAGVGHRALAPCGPDDRQAPAASGRCPLGGRLTAPQPFPDFPCFS